MNNRLIVIGITGVARSGKDTVAKMLCARHGFTRVALADGVRSAFSDIDGPTWELRKELEEAGKSTRGTLQTIGTECRVDVGHPRLWIGLALVKIAYLTRYHPCPRARFVIPDIRFPAEVSELGHDIPIRLDGSFRVWRVWRDGAGLSGAEGRHPSEVEIDRIKHDLILRNNGSFLELESDVDRYITQYLETVQ